MGLLTTNFDYFIRCSEYKSFQEAATYLGISQPAISKAISNLENQLGTALFLRTKKGISLTEKGQALYDALTSEHRKLNEKIQSILQSNFQPRLRIGSIPAFAIKYLLPALKKMKNVRIDQIMTDGTLSCEKAVGSGRLDFAFGAFTTKPRTLKSIFIKDDPIAIVGLRSKFAHIEKAKSMNDLADEVWLDNINADYEWNVLSHPTHETYIANDALAPIHLIMEGEAIGMMQLDQFTPAQLKLLVKAPFHPTGNSPQRGFSPPDHHPKIFLIYREGISESIRPYLETFAQIGK